MFREMSKIVHQTSHEMTTESPFNPHIHKNSELGLINSKELRKQKMLVLQHFKMAACFNHLSSALLRTHSLQTVLDNRVRADCTHEQKQ